MIEFDRRLGCASRIILDNNTTGLNRLITSVYFTSLIFINEKFGEYSTFRGTGYSLPDNIRHTDLMDAGFHIQGTINKPCEAGCQSSAYEIQHENLPRLGSRSVDPSNCRYLRLIRIQSRADRDLKPRPQQGFDR